jgi:hypothetical protein
LPERQPVPEPDPALSRISPEDASAPCVCMPTVSVPHA